MEVCKSERHERILPPQRIFVKRGQETSKLIHMEGEELVVPSTVLALPEICCRCGSDACSEKVPQLFSWHHPGFYAAILLGFIPYLFVGQLVSKHHRLQVSLCAEHARKRRFVMIAGYALALVTGIGAWLFIPRGKTGGLVALGVVALAFLIGYFMARRAERILGVMHIDDDESRFVGAAPELVAAARTALAAIRE